MTQGELVAEKVNPEYLGSRQPGDAEAAFEVAVCALYRQTGSLELTAELMDGVSTATQVARIVRRNGGDVNDPGRPSLVETLGEQIRAREDRFPTRAELARYFGVSPSTVYRALDNTGEI